MQTLANGSPRRIYNFNPYNPMNPETENVATDDSVLYYSPEDIQALEAT